MNLSQARPKLIIALLAPFLITLSVAADSAALRVEDSQTFLRQNMTPAGLPAARFSQKIEKLLRSGAELRVSFDLKPEDLSFIGPDNRRILEPREFDVELRGLTKSFECR